METREKAAAILGVLCAIVEVVKAAGDNGVPSGHIYAMCMGGMSLEVYQELMALLVESGRVRRSGWVYYYV